MQAVNAAGDVVEFDGKQWVPVEGGKGGKGGKASKAPTPSAEAPKLTTGAINAGLVGMGDFFNTVGMNARDLFAQATGNVEAQAGIVDERAEAARLREMLQAEAPIASRVGAAIPGLATMPIGMGIGGAGMLAGTAGRIGTQLALGAAQGAAGSESGEFGQDAALGGVLAGAGQMAGNIVGRVKAAREAVKSTQRGGAQALEGTLSEGERAILAGAEDAGMLVTPGQRIGSRQARQLEVGLAANPVTSKVFQDIEQHNITRLNNLAAKAMGLSDEVDNVGPIVRNAAAQRLSDEFETIGKTIGAVETAPILKELEKVAGNQALELVPRVEAANLMSKIRSGVKNRSGELPGAAELDAVTGESLMAQRSQLSKAMRDAFQNGRAEQGDAYADLIEIVDNAAKRAATQNAGDPAAGLAMAARYDKAREGYSVLRALDRGGASPEGNVFPGQMARMMGQSHKTGFVRGLGEGGEDLTRRSLRGVPGGDPLGEFYDGLRWRTSSLGKPIAPNTGGTAGAMGQWMASGGTLPTVTRLAGSAARRLTAYPLTRAYANMSPEAATTAAAMVAAVKAQQRGATQLGGSLGVGGAGALDTGQ